MDVQNVFMDIDYVLIFHTMASVAPERNVYRPHRHHPEMSSYFVIENVQSFRYYFDI